MLTCEFANFLEEALCECFVSGLQDKSIQCRLLSEADLALTKALTIAYSVERAQKELKEIHRFLPSSSPFMLCFICDWICENCPYWHNN